MKELIDIINDYINKLEKLKNLYTKNTEHFKIGDRVQFKTWEEMKEEFGIDEDGEIDCMFNFTEDMKHLCGTYATITDMIYNVVALDDFTAKENVDCWAYSTDMIKLANKELEIKKFTEDEKAILRNVAEKWKWIARDENGELYLYNDKPEKDKAIWEYDTNCLDFFFFKHIFNSISWSDSEPCEFRKFI